MSDIDLTLANGWVLSLLVPICIYLAFQVYRTRHLAWLLGVRIAALLLVIVLLMAPILAVRFQTTRKPLVAVLVDRSESMKIADGNVVRRDVVKALLALDAFDALIKTARLQNYQFAESLKAVDDIDALVWDGQATNLAGAFDALHEETVGQGLGAVVVLTDGGQNQGRRPERAAVDLGVPVFAVGIGDPVPPKDVAVVSGVMDRLGYVGRKLSLAVRFQASGYDGIQERVVVRDGNREVASQVVQLRDGEQAFTFDIQPARAGRHAYQVHIAPQAGERTVENNTVVVATEVLESRVRLLILAGSPSADLAYLRRLWSADENLELDVVLNHGQNGWDNQVQSALRQVSKYDVVVLIDVAHTTLAGDGEERLVSFVKAGGGLLTIGGASAFGSTYAISPLAHILPWQMLRNELTYQEALCPIFLPQAVRRHPILRVSDDPLADETAWRALPPLLAYNRVLEAVPSATVLAVHETERVNGNPMPVMAVMPVERGKSMAIGFRTFWRHGLLMWGIGKNDVVSQTFWKNVVRWLVTPEDVARIKAVADKPTYRSGEPVAVYAQVFDGLLEPLVGARVVAVASDSLGMREVVLRDEGNGRYVGTLGGFAQGDYTFEVKATYDGTDVGQTRNAFTVDRYSLEYETVRMNAELLVAVANNSGGKFLKPEELGDVVRGLDFAPEPIEVAYQGRLWGQQWPLFLLVGLLAVEWAVRRRRGMV
jgi:uncharacterized membrane protein